MKLWIWYNLDRLYIFNHLICFIRYNKNYTGKRISILYNTYPIVHTQKYGLIELGNLLFRILFLFWNNLKLFKSGIMLKAS